VNRNENKGGLSREELGQKALTRRWRLLPDFIRNKELSENFKSRTDAAELADFNRDILSTRGNGARRIYYDGGTVPVKTVRSVHNGYDYENQIIDPVSKRPIPLSRFDRKGRLVWAAADFGNQEAVERLFRLSVDHPFENEIPKAVKNPQPVGNAGAVRAAPPSSGSRPPVDSTLTPDQQTANKGPVIDGLTRTRNKFLFDEEGNSEISAGIRSHTGGWLVGPEKWGRVMRGVRRAAGGPAVGQAALNAIVKEDAVSELAARREAAKLNIAYTGGTVEDVRDAAARYQSDLDNHNKKTVS
jgi:hypothetical protein